MSEPALHVDGIKEAQPSAAPDSGENLHVVEPVEQAAETQARAGAETAAFTGTVDQAKQTVADSGVGTQTDVAKLDSQRERALTAQQELLKELEVAKSEYAQAKQKAKRFGRFSGLTGTNKVERAVATVDVEEAKQRLDAIRNKLKSESGKNVRELEESRDRLADHEAKSRKAKGLSVKNFFTPKFEQAMTAFENENRGAELREQYDTQRAEFVGNNIEAMLLEQGALVDTQIDSEYKNSNELYKLHKSLGDVNIANAIGWEPKGRIGMVFGRALNLRAVVNLGLVGGGAIAASSGFGASALGLLTARSLIGRSASSAGIYDMLRLRTKKKTEKRLGEVDINELSDEELNEAIADISSQAIINGVGRSDGARMIKNPVYQKLVVERGRRIQEHRDAQEQEGIARLLSNELGVLMKLTDNKQQEWVDDAVKNNSKLAVAAAGLGFVVLPSAFKLVFGAVVAEAASLIGSEDAASEAIPELAKEIETLQSRLTQIEESGVTSGATHDRVVARLQELTEKYNQLTPLSEAEPSEVGGAAVLVGGGVEPEHVVEVASSGPGEVRSSTGEGYPVLEVEEPDASEDPWPTSIRHSIVESEGVGESRHQPVFVRPEPGSTTDHSGPQIEGGRSGEIYTLDKLHQMEARILAMRIRLERLDASGTARGTVVQQMRHQFERLKEEYAGAIEARELMRSEDIKIDSVGEPAVRVVSPALESPEPPRPSVEGPTSIVEPERTEGGHVILSRPVKIEEDIRGLHEKIAHMAERGITTGSTIENANREISELTAEYEALTGDPVPEEVGAGDIYARARTATPLIETAPTPPASPIESGDSIRATPLAEKISSLEAERDGLAKVGFTSGNRVFDRLNDEIAGLKVEYGELEGVEPLEPITIAEPLHLEADPTVPPSEIEGYQELRVAALNGERDTASRLEAVKKMMRQKRYTIVKLDVDGQQVVFTWLPSKEMQFEVQGTDTVGILTDSEASWSEVPTLHPPEPEPDLSPTPAEALAESRAKALEWEHPDRSMSTGLYVEESADYLRRLESGKPTGRQVWRDLTGAVRATDDALNKVLGDEYGETPEGPIEKPHTFHAADLERARALAAAQEEAVRTTDTTPHDVEDQATILLSQENGLMMKRVGIWFRIVEGPNGQERLLLGPGENVTPEKAMDELLGEHYRLAVERHIETSFTGDPNVSHAELNGYINEGRKLPLMPDSLRGFPLPKLVHELYMLQLSRDGLLDYGQEGTHAMDLINRDIEMIKGIIHRNFGHIIKDDPQYVEFELRAQETPELLNVKPAFKAGADVNPPFKSEGDQFNPGRTTPVRPRP